MSKVLLINGSPNEHGCTYTALKEIADTLAQNDVECQAGGHLSIEEE